MTKHLKMELAPQKVKCYPAESKLSPTHSGQARKKCLLNNVPMAMGGRSSTEGWLFLESVILCRNTSRYQKNPSFIKTNTNVCMVIKGEDSRM